MTPMPGKRQTGVGMNRAEKKKVVTVATVEEESESDDEAEDDPQAPPAPPLPTLEPPPPALVESVAAEVPSAAIQFKQQLAEAKAAVRAAQRDVNKKERKWERVKKSYLDNEKYSIWDVRSVVQRVEMRLFRADIELGRARAVLVQRSNSYTRLRCFLIWHKRLVACAGKDPLVERFYQRAFARVQQPAPCPLWKSMWPGMSHNIWDWNRQNYGLALTMKLDSY